MDISINLAGEEDDEVRVGDAPLSFDDTAIQIGGLDLVLNWGQVQSLVRALAPYFEPDCLVAWATPPDDPKRTTLPIR